MPRSYYQLADELSLCFCRDFKRTSFRRQMPFFHCKRQQIVAIWASTLQNSSISTANDLFLQKTVPFQRKKGCFLLKRLQINAKSCFMSQKGFAASHSVLKNRVLFCTRGYVDLDLSLFFKKIFKHLSKFILFRFDHKTTIGLTFVQIIILLMIVFSLIEFLSFCYFCHNWITICF